MPHKKLKDRTKAQLASRKKRRQRGYRRVESVVPIDKIDHVRDLVRWFLTEGGDQ